MSDDTEPARRAIARMAANRDEVRAELIRQSEYLEKQFKVALASATGPYRKKLLALRAESRQQFAAVEIELDRQFSELTKGYDEETGTLEGVAQEAADMLAGVLD